MLHIDSLRSTSAYRSYNVYEKRAFTTGKSLQKFRPLGFPLNPHESDGVKRVLQMFQHWSKPLDYMLALVHQRQACSRLPAHHYIKSNVTDSTITLASESVSHGRNKLAASFIPVVESLPTNVQTSVGRHDFLYCRGTRFFSTFLTLNEHMCPVASAVKSCPERRSIWISTGFLERHS
ncbi:hypothetical protein BC832DRAFT_45427 [Gaertneriomyces semiglobifer]|nr:hypothetical protein BC832DRAFT_45427 [Gaertneriomyces semiglobifer]